MGIKAIAVEPDIGAYVVDDLENSTVGIQRYLEGLMIVSTIEDVDNRYELVLIESEESESGSPNRVLTNVKEGVLRVLYGKFLIVGFDKETNDFTSVPDNKIGIYLNMLNRFNKLVSSA